MHFLQFKIMSIQLNFFTFIFMFIFFFFIYLFSYRHSIKTVHISIIIVGVLVPWIKRMYGLFFYLEFLKMYVMHWPFDRKLKINYIKRIDKRGNQLIIAQEQQFKNKRKSFFKKEEEKAKK